MQALLQSVDRSTAIGKRDYIMLLLIVTYGLRVSEVVTLKLEDIKWKANCLHVFQHKTGTSLMLPLTDAVGNGVIDYLPCTPLVAEDIRSIFNAPNRAEADRLLQLTYRQIC